MASIAWRSLTRTFLLSVFGAGSAVLLQAQQILPSTLVDDSTSGPLVTITQHGSGDALRTNGNVYVNGTLTSNSTITAQGFAASANSTLSGNTGSGALLTVNQAGAALALAVTGGISVSGSMAVIPSVGSGPAIYTISGVGQGVSATGYPGIEGIGASHGYGGVFSGTGTGPSAFDVALWVKDGAKFDGHLYGTHVQDLGTGDSPTFNGLDLNYGVLDLGSVALQDFGSSDLKWTVGASTMLEFDLGTFDPRLYTPAVTVAAQKTGTVTLLVKGIASQTADLLHLQNSSGTNEFAVSPAGALSGAHVQNLGSGDNPAFASLLTTGEVNGGTNVVANAFAGSGVFKIYNGSGVLKAGVTGGTCSHFTGGICDTL